MDRYLDSGVGTEESTIFTYASLLGVSSTESKQDLVHFLAWLLKGPSKNIYKGPPIEDTEDIIFVQSPRTFTVATRLEEIGVRITTTDNPNTNSWPLVIFGEEMSS
jgi:hypothetical protein